MVRSSRLPWSGLLAVLALAFAAGFAYAPSPTAAAAVSNQAERPDYQTRIVLIPEPGRLRVRFTLSKPVTRFRFANAVEAIQSDTWSMATPGLALDQAVVSAADGAPFKTFDILIRPDSRQRDRIYPALSAVGEGWLVFAPYLQPSAAPADVSFEARPGWISVRSGGEGLTTRGYASIGPASQVARGRVTVITAAGAPEWLSRSIRDDTEAAIGFYTRRLGVRLEHRPVLVIGYEPDRDAGWRGDTSEGTVAVRFYSKSWGARSDQARSQVSRFVSHEFFHLWNSELFSPSENDEQAWLHEGAAEYAALMAARASGRLSDPELREELGRNYSGCARWLGTKGLAARPPKGGSAIYQCGVLVQWLADLQTRSATGGGRDVLGVWRAVFADAATHGRRYGVREFLAKVPTVTAPDSLVRRVIDPGGADRWSALARAMALKGAVVEASASPELDRVTLIFHVLGQSCHTGTIGFWTEPDYLKLDSGGECGAISGSPKVDAVQGHNLITDAPGAFDAVAAACLAKAPVVFSYQGKAVGTAGCAKPLGDHPVAWTVVRTTVP